MRPETRYSQSARDYSNRRHQGPDRTHYASAAPENSPVGRATTYPPRNHDFVPRRDPPGPAEHQPPGPPPTGKGDKPIRSRANWEKSKRRFRDIEHGYSKLQTLYGGVAFAATMLYTLVKMNNVGDIIRQAKDECDHAEVIIEQLDAALGCVEAGRELRSDRAGRKFLENMEKVRDDIVTVVDDLRDRVEKYEGERLGFTEKTLFYVNDSQKIYGLRGRLRQHLSNLQDLSVWLHRPSLDINHDRGQSVR